LPIVKAPRPEHMSLGYLSPVAKLKNTHCQQVLRVQHLLKSTLGHLSPVANNL
jgi:hypothetical protein